MSWDYVDECFRGRLGRIEYRNSAADDIWNVAADNDLKSATKCYARRANLFLAVPGWIVLLLAGAALTISYGENLLRLQFVVAVSFIAVISAYFIRPRRFWLVTVKLQSGSSVEALQTQDAIEADAVWRDCQYFATGARPEETIENLPEGHPHRDILIRAELERYERTPGLEAAERRNALAVTLLRCAGLMAVTVAISVVGIVVNEAYRLSKFLQGPVWAAATGILGCVAAISLVAGLILLARARMSAAWKQAKKGRGPSYRYLRVLTLIVCLPYLFATFAVTIIALFMVVLIAGCLMAWMFSGRRE